MNHQTILQKAKKNLSNPDKWLKDGAYVQGDCMCALGAVYKALDPKAEAPEDLTDKAQIIAMVAEDRLDSAVRKYTNFGMNCIISFNDRSDTTHEDLMNVFDVAISTDEQPSTTHEDLMNVFDVAFERMGKHDS